GERCEIVDGPSIASETARRLTCDCFLQTYYEVDGKLVDLGRQKRSISPRMRKALEQRDKRCVFPGCDRTRHLEAHHIVHWAHKGETKLVNLGLLCWHHHTLVHEGGFAMRIEDDMTFTFFRPDSSVVPLRPELGRGDPHALVTEHRQEQIAIDERTCTTLWDGRPINYEDCVHALFTENGMLAKTRRRGPPEADLN
ncbi:MAG: HNH endonuclease, partial [Actinobacteria bacterium]|nr:HNH endonuclease [Actinomycetota bacterium]